MFARRWGRQCRGQERRAYAVALVCAVVWGGIGRAEGQTAPDPPMIDPVRYTEDYSYLRDAGPDAAAALWPWAPFKYIPLNERGDIYLTLGAEFRLRYEWMENANWGEGPQDDDGYLWARAMPLADVHIGENVRLFGQFITAYVVGQDGPTTPVDENRADVLQAFADLRLPLGNDATLTLRPGRQLLAYGSGRLIDIRYGPNVPLPFDAAKIMLETDGWRFDAFYARPTDQRIGEFDDRPDDDQALWALYGTYQPADSIGGFDAYYIGYRDRDAVFGDFEGRELRHTIGSRIFGELHGWDWNFELFYQFGEFDDGDISAWSFASDTGYTFSDVTLQPRLALRANVISGDRDPADADVQTFNPLFPRGKYFGELSPIGPSNLIHINPYAQLQLTDKLQLFTNLALYWRQSTKDGIYAMGNMNVVRPGQASDARYIGTQAEVLLLYQLDRHTSLSASYSIFTAGEFIRETGDDEPIHFVGLEAMYRF